LNLAECLENTAKRIPNQVGLHFEGGNYTFQELNRLSNRIANGLSAIGLKQGDRCILMMQSSLEFIITYYALAKMGAVIIPVNFLFKSHELLYIFRHSGATCFIGMAPYLDEPLKVLRDLLNVKIRIAVGIREDSSFLSFDKVDGPDDFPTYPAQDNEVAAIIYTSGTTGLPKGAMLTHGNMLSNAKLAERRRDELDTVIISALPLYHIFGQTAVLNASVYLGLTLHLFRQFEPERMIKVIEQERKTILFAVPTMLRRLVLETDHSGIKRSSLKYCISGGDSLPVGILYRFEERFKTKIYEGYGLTECSPSCIRNPIGGKTKPGSIGLPLFGFDVRIVDDSGRDVERKELGELIVKGPGVMKGYLNSPEETAKTIVDGWLYTGDLARMDEEGYIYIVDRKKDLIIRGGYNVYPREIEEVFFMHPRVADAAVYGVPHEDLGEEITAAVVLKRGEKVTEEDLRQFVKERVAPYKYPRIIHLVDDLPKSHTGKVLKSKLREGLTVTSSGYHGPNFLI
jgi:long-chain acyl-CoA synthetase